MSIDQEDRPHQRVDPKDNRYPYCIVWSPLPPISWVLPFIGHTGICTSEGVIHDFAGPYTIGTEQMAFGNPTRYIQLDPTKCRKMDWDAGVEEGNRIYRKRMHNICCDNCHNHVAQCLNEMGYKTGNYGMISIGVWCFFEGKFTSVSAIVKTYLPFTIILFLILYFSGSLS